MTLRREKVLLVGDSIVSRIEAVDLPNIEVMAGHGCKTWDDNNPTWMEKLMTPLSRRLKDTPRVKLLFIHLGANDTAISLDRFEVNYRLFLANMRYAIWLSSVRISCLAHPYDAALTSVKTQWW